MTPRVVSSSILLFLLVAASLALKDRAQTLPEKAFRAQIVAKLTRQLAARGYSVTIEPHIYQSAIVRGVRGACRVAVRDAAGGPSLHETYVQQAASTGPLRYSYRGRISARPPGIRHFIDKIMPLTLDSFGIHRSRPVPIAFAASPACPADPLHLPDIRFDP